MGTAESRKLQRIGCVIGLMATPFWWAMAISTEQWVTLPVHALYTAAWAKKFYYCWVRFGG